MKCFKVLCFAVLFALIASEEEEADATVEFSSHLADRPIENAKNASIVTSDEIEVGVPYDKEIQNEKLSAVYDIEGNSSTVFENNDVVNESSSIQDTKINTTANATDTKSKMKVECTPRIIPENEIPTVTLANSTVLLKVLAPVANKNSTTGDCVVVLFYSNQCVFSARMAPHFNALPRVFPDISFYAVDVVETGKYDFMDVYLFMELHLISVCYLFWMGFSVCFRIIMFSPIWEILQLFVEKFLLC
ncbi:hypothetical protein TNCT_652741 [Trichonephila clavata]|uniref:Thioredoxin domain-containing protein n=1 Tax=Trichonephila clavata TaxID=2740835 RepID=A0A8X6GJP7_TRICU|nr:hypothetical protein TNCT_652741 [Trichonephila clavata]